MDTLLEPIALKQQSYTKDTTDFIHFIEKTKIGQDAILVSMDVKSLYTNIPEEEGTPGNSMQSISLRIKRFLASSSRKLGREQRKKRNDAITRLETLATQASKAYELFHNNDPANLTHSLREMLGLTPVSTS